MAFVRADVSEKRLPSVIRVTRIGEPGKKFTVTSNPARSVLRLIVTANVVPSLPILVNLMTKAMLSSKTLLHTRRNILEDDILHSRRRETLKSYIAFINRLGSLAET
jgi:hypothetical protein